MNKFICAFFVIITLAACNTDRPNNQGLDRKMTEMLESYNYFRLETALNNSGSQLSEFRELYFRAMLEKAFNRTEESLQTIERLFSNHKKSMNDSLIVDLLIAKFNNHIKRFEYKQGVESLVALLESYSHAMNSVDMESLQKDTPCMNC